MKMMIISDIHGSYENLKRVMDIFDEEQMDKLVILGDILYHGPRNDLPCDYAPKKVIPLLNSYKDRIIAVRGNCDAEVDQMVLQFSMRSDYLEMFLDGHRFFMTHGHLYNEEHLPPLNDGDVFMYGHFHKPVAKKVGNKTFFNPSSISLPKEGVKSYGVYENNKLNIYSLEKEVLYTIKL